MYPLNFFISLSTACNSKCVMCPTQMSPNRKKFISKSIFDKIVTDITPFATEIEGFHLGVHGEPLLDKDLAHKISMLKDIGVNRTIIATNGSLMDETMAQELLEADPWIVIFSLESMDKEVYSKIRVGLDHEVVVQNIERFIRLRNERNSNVRVSIRFIVSEWNESEKESFVEYWNNKLDLLGRVDYIEADPIHNWGYGDPDEFYGNNPCSHINSITILSDGIVSACCLDHDAVHNFGDLNEHSLLDIFNGEKFSCFRNMHLTRRRRELPLCKTCNIAELWANRTQKHYQTEGTFIAAQWVKES